MVTRRPPPCLTVRIPGKPRGQHARNASAPSFGISTYSHRVRRPSAGQSRTSTDTPSSLESDAEMEIAAVALAQVGSRAPSRLLVRPSEAGGGAGSTSASLVSHSIPISVDIHPPTPAGSALPVTAASSPSPSSRRPAADRAVKQSRRVASIYSISGAGALGETSSGRDSFYLRPDLSGRSGLSLEQLPRSVSLEDLTIPTPGEASSTGAVEGGALHSRAHSASSVTSSLYSTASPSSPPRGGDAASFADSHVALAAHAVPPAQSQSSLPGYASQAPSYHPPPQAQRGRFSEILAAAATGARPETEADKLKRLYLCPWEGTSPRPATSSTAAAAVAPARSRSLRARLGVGASLPSSQQRAHDPEKGNYPSYEQVERVPSPAERRRKRLLPNLAFLLLAVAVLADLIVLNVRVFAGRDAYLSE
ncbi:hypothetical protein JCM10213_000406 [Rhodosporidiobolus nylandii]